MLQARILSPNVPKRGADGMIVTMGGCFGGYALYLLKGKPEQRVADRRYLGTSE